MPKSIAGVKMYTLAEVADVLEVTPRTAYAYIKADLDGKGVTRLRAQRIGGKWFVSEDNLRAFLNKTD
jgi:hypothetical protein